MISRTLQLGSTGSDVSQLETKLQSLKLYLGKIDGSFGPMLKASVISYQKLHGLVQDGIAGPITLTSLGLWQAPTPNTTKSAWHLAVEEYIGVYSNFTQAYSNIKGRGWIDYESLKYTLQQSFDEIKAKQPLNCSNWSLILYCIAKDLKIYDVHFQHVECVSGGHIRLVIMGGEFPTVTKGNYSQYTRVDGASRADVNDEYPIGTVWCPNGTILSYDDSWLMAGVNFNLPL